MPERPVQPPSFAKRRRSPFHAMVVAGLLFLSGVAVLLILRTLDPTFLSGFSSWSPSVEHIACTMDAKLCPDGSSVGRIPPDCAFAPCPIPGDPAEASWSTTVDQENGVSFRYPGNLRTTYIHIIEWPPRVSLTDGPLECFQAGEGTEERPSRERRTIGSREYCVEEESDAAAGSVYTAYAYSTGFGGDRVATLRFTLREVQCANYDEVERTACERERALFDLDGIVSRIAESIHDS